MGCWVHFLQCYLPSPPCFDQITLSQSKLVSRICNRHVHNSSICDVCTGEDSSLSRHHTHFLKHCLVLRWHHPQQDDLVVIGGGLEVALHFPISFQTMPLCMKYLLMVHCSCLVSKMKLTALWAHHTHFVLRRFCVQNTFVHLSSFVLRRNAHFLLRRKWWSRLRHWNVTVSVSCLTDQNWSWKSKHPGLYHWKCCKLSVVLESFHSKAHHTKTLERLSYQNKSLYS